MGALARATQELSGFTTPAGPILVERAGLQLIRLQGLLRHLWGSSPEFQDLLADIASRGCDGVGGLLLYFDDLRPVNPPAARRG